MRAAQIIGIILIVLGAYVLIRGLSYKTNETAVDIGDLELEVEERHVIPPWAGALAGGVGLVLLVSGSRRRT
ncbi:MAG TPA: hypothetical protein VFH97_01350 [Gemmatimonadales bacterium]|nr:hypothetical protein [Gemmatimonadales bacterium]